MFNIGLLIKTLSIQTKSYNDGDMIEFITRFLKKNKLKFKKDSYGNIYVKKGKAETYPCIVAHTDTVHSKIEEAAFKIYKTNDILFAIDTSKGQQVGIGGDDKAGVYVALQTLLDKDIVKAVFYRDEEVGRIGSRASIKEKKSFYDDCGFILQCDRKGSSDFITKSGGINMVSEDFMNDLSPTLEKYGFKKETGVCTDVDVLVKGHVGVSCANISTGYYRPHSSTEIVKISELKNTFNFVMEIFDTVGENVYEYEYVEPVYNYSSNYSNYSSYTSSSDKIFFKGQNLPYIYKGKKESTTYLKFDELIPTYPRLVTESEYDLKNKEIIIPIAGHKCEDCDKKNCIVYYPPKEMFMCKACGNFKDYLNDIYNETPELYKNLVVRDGKQEFVYSRTDKSWLKKQDAVWSVVMEAYQAKSALLS